MRALGLKSPYWRFEITPHQQLALERLQTNLKNRAIVCYACPVFHKESLLHKWTVEPRIVEHSTFPDISSLAGHIAWNFSEPGARGVANVDPTHYDGPSFAERLHTLVARDERVEGSPIEELERLVVAVNSAMYADSVEPTALQAQFADATRVINQIADVLAEGEGRSAVAAYGTVLLFTDLNRLSWLVAGNGD